MKILIFSSDFALDKDVGAKRMSSLALYLDSQNIDVTVVTKHKDYTLPKEYSGIHIIDSHEDLSRGNGFYNYCQFYKNEMLIVSQFMEIVKAEQYDCVIASGSPFYYFALAQAAYEIGIPCIIDFRDPWTFDFRGIKDTISVRKNLYRLSHVLDEKEAIKYCTAFVSVTPGWVRDFKKKYPKYSSKCFLVENGYESISVEEENNIVKQGDKIVICVFGKMTYYTQKYANIFFSATSRYSDKLKIIQIGKEENSTVFLPKKDNINDYFHSTGFIDYGNGLQYLKNADALLLIDNRKNALGTKVYDYIFTNKPIIYVGPKNTALSDLVSKFEFGFSCQTKKDIINALEFIITQKPQFLDNCIDLKIYSRERQNKKWIDLIYQCINNWHTEKK